MITIILKGGLGNQMFQYAAGRSLSISRDVHLALETSNFGIEKFRKYELNCFKINISSVHVSLPCQESYQIKLFDDLEDASQKSTVLVVEDRFINRLIPHQLINNFLPADKKYYYHEKQYNLNPIFFDLASNVVLEGYWQTEKYFKNIENIIRQDFQFSSMPNLKNQTSINEISSCNAVSIHVRHGDYLTNPEVQAVHGICSIEYYQNAIKYMRNKIDSPHFFVFSDNIAWCQENLKIPDMPVTFIDHNQGENSYDDMRLMSHCKHHIIANSSFSWWGAWLNPGLDKIVIAPKKWFAKSMINTQDILPEMWIAL